MKKTGLLIFAFICVFNLNAQYKLYVSPFGNDANIGSKTQPLASLTGARNTIRKLKKKQLSKKEAFWVIVENGKYFMKEPLVLLPEDSGTKEYPIIYKAAKGAKPVFSGGKIVSNFIVNTSGLWEAKIPETIYYKWKFDQLYVNNKRANLARTPNQGFLKIDTVSQNIWNQGTSKVAEKAEQSIYFNKEDSKILEEISKEDVSNIRFKAFHKWDFTLRYLDAIDADSAKIVTSGKGMKPWNPLKKDRRVIFENYEAALDAPGEWFLNNEGSLLYMPHNGETIENTEVVTPVLENLITIKGNALQGLFVENIYFKDLTFTDCHYKIPSTGSEPNQAATILNAAIMVEGARQIKITNCELSNIGQHAIWFGKGCHNSEVKHTYIHNIGGGGIYLGDFKPLEGSSHTHDITVENNIIKSGGQDFPAAVGVWVGHSSNNSIIHNDIGNFYYSGISVGWVWGYKPSLAKKNSISYNHIHHIGWDLLSDMAGIYMLGESEGTKVEHNVIHDVHAYSYGGWGMYADEGSTGITFKNNLVYNTKTGGFQQNYGKENIVQNNILAFAKRYQLQCTVPEEHRSFSFTNNIIIFKEGMVAKGAWDKVNAKMDKNIYWNVSGKDYNFNNHTFKTWKKMGFDTNSLLSNPYFIDANNYNFNFERTLNYKKIDFKPFNYAEAGVYGTPSWLKKAKLSTSIITAFKEAVETNMKKNIKR